MTINVNDNIKDHCTPHKLNYDQRPLHTKYFHTQTFNYDQGIYMIRKCIPIRVKHILKTQFPKYNS